MIIIRRLVVITIVTLVSLAYPAVASQDVAPSPAATMAVSA